MSAAFFNHSLFPVPTSVVDSGLYLGLDLVAINSRPTEALAVLENRMSRFLVCICPTMKLFMVVVTPES